MIIKKKFCIIIVYILVIVPVHGTSSFCAHKQRCEAKKCAHKPDILHKGARFIEELIIDALDINYNLLSVNSAKIITAFIPPYLMTRYCDETIQSNFYDQSLHKNINQFPPAAHNAAKYGVGIPMVALSSLALFGPTQDIRMTGRIFAIALPFVHSGKDIIKKMNCHACLRPWHEEFDKHHRSTGGFPSGHMANVTFMATLFGMRYGARWGIPLSLLAAFVAADFINCNRHYASQVVAGAGLGVMFAFAADNVISKKLSHTVDWSVACNKQGLPEMLFTYRF